MGMEIDFKMLKRIIKELFKFGFATIGVMWSLIEVMEKYFYEYSFVQSCMDNISVLLIPAIFVTIFKLFHMLYFEFGAKFRRYDLNIVVSIGDILKCKNGVIVVGTNNQLSTDKEKIAIGSIHSQMIEKYGQDHLNRIFNSIDKEIEKDLKYFQGEIEDQDFLFLPMSDINNKGAAKSTVKMVEEAIDNLFRNQDNLSIPSNKIFIPILGTGAGGLKLSKHDAIKIIIESFLKFDKESDNESISKIKTMNIVVGWKDIFEVNWYELNKWLELQNDYCLDCKSIKKD